MAQNIPHKIASLTAALAVLTFSIGIHAADFADFAPATTQTVDLDPRGLASGDLNNDGVPDLVSVNNDTGNVSVLLGDPLIPGSFATAVNYDVTDPANVNASPFSVAIGDVVGSTAPDLVVAKLASGDNEIVILVGNGDGTFATPITLSPAPVFNDPRDVILLDIDADADLEIVVAEWGAGSSVRVFLNDNAAITFTEAPNSPFASGILPFGMVYADATDDGIADLVLVNNDSPTNTVSILAGTGNASFFQTRTTVATGSTPFSVAVGDLNGIVGLDMAVANSGANTISVLLSDGMGGFLPKVDTAVGTTPNEVAIVNISGDINLDVVVTNRGSNNISVLEGDGTGGFSGAASSFAAGTLPSALAVDDFDGDGNVDVAAANISSAMPLITGTSVSVLINDHPPVAGVDSFDVINGSTNNVLDVLANDSDPDVGDTLTITAAGPGDQGGTIDFSSGTNIVYTPAVADATETFTYTVEDQFGYGATATVSVTSVPANQAPIFTSVEVTAAPEDAAYIYNITTSDPNGGDTHTITATILPAQTWLTLTDNNDGTAILSGTPINAEVGDYTVDLLVTDSGTPNLTDTQMFIVNVTNTNDAPVAVGVIGAQSGTEGAAFSPLLDVTGNFTDPDGDTLAYSLSGLPAGTGLSIDTNAVISGTLTAADATASPIAVTVTATDPGTLSATQPFTLTVATTNVAPSFTSAAVTAATEGVVYSYDITSTDANAGDTLAITAPTLPAWLTLTDNGDGTATLSGTPASTDVGDDPVSLLVTDSGVGNLSDTQPFTITVAAAASGGGGGGGGGGCTLNTADTAKDPLIPLLLVAALGALYRRRNRKSIIKSS